MAKTIGQLTQATTIGGSDEFVIEQTGITKRVAASVVRGGLVNADVASNAAIAFSKLAALDSANILVGNGSNVATKVAVSGDATISNAGAVTLAAASITGKTQLADPLASGDEFLVHDASSSALRRVAYSSISPTVAASNLDGVAKDGSGNNLSVGTAPVFGCRAWVNFNGTSTTTVDGESRCSIRASGNVTKVVRTGTGLYTVTFTTALEDANYAFSISGHRGDGGGANVGFIGGEGASANGYVPTTTTLKISTQTGSNGSAIDWPCVVVAVFR
jgi:hypothetical protein